MTNNEKQVKQQVVEAAEAVAAAAKDVVVEAEAKVVRVGKAVTAKSASLEQAMEQVKVARTAARKAATLTRRAIAAKVTAIWKAMRHRKTVAKSHA